MESTVALTGAADLEPAQARRTPAAGVRAASRRRRPPALRSIKPAGARPRQSGGSRNSKEAPMAASDVRSYDAYSPPEIHRRVGEFCLAKATLPLLPMAMLGLLAG